jgi:hypothetical protein
MKLAILNVTTAFMLYFIERLFQSIYRAFSQKTWLRLGLKFYIRFQSYQYIKIENSIWNFNLNLNHVFCEDAYNYIKL